MNLTDSFLNEIKTLYEAEISDHVFQHSKLALLDYLAVSIAGAKSQQDKLKTYIEVAEPEPGKFTVFGLDQKYNLKEAVFLNGLNAHALDLDDGVNEGIIHLGSPLFSVLLPLAQKYNVQSDKFFKAVIIGYETAFSVAVSIQPRHKELGYHATGTCGILGIALAVSYMLDFTEDERKNALATACVSATGVLNVLDDGSELKPYNVAKTALLGLISCQMALAGYKGPSDPIGSERGFLRMMTDKKNTVLRKPSSDGRYAVEKTYTKPYAACRYCHPAIDAAVRLSTKKDFDVAAIETVEVKTYYWAVDKHDHVEIPTVASAKMSIPYGVAIGFLKGKAGLAEYSEQYINEAGVRELLKKITVISDDELTDIFPEKTVAIVSVKLNDGSEFSEKIEQPKGEPENPLTQAEFEQRFVDLFIYGGKTEAEALSVLDYVRTLDAGVQFSLPIFD